MFITITMMWCTDWAPEYNKQQQQQQQKHDRSTTSNTRNSATT